MQPQAQLLTAAEVRQLLAREIDNVLANPDVNPLRRAEMVARLARVTLDAIEVGDVAARVEAIAATLRDRKDDNNTEEKQQ